MLTLTRSGDTALFDDQDSQNRFLYLPEEGDPERVYRWLTGHGYKATCEPGGVIAHRVRILDRHCECPVRLDSQTRRGFVIRECLFEMRDWADTLSLGWGFYGFELAQFQTPTELKAFIDVHIAATHAERIRTSWTTSAHVNEALLTVVNIGFQGSTPLGFYDGRDAGVLYLDFSSGKITYSWRPN